MRSSELSSNAVQTLDNMKAKTEGISTSVNNSKETNKISPPCFSNAETNSPLDSDHFNTKYRHIEDQDYTLAISKSFEKLIRKWDF